MFKQTEWLNSSARLPATDAARRCSKNAAITSEMASNSSMCRQATSEPDLRNNHSSMLHTEALDNF